jgi:hypothetical protein
MLGGMARPRSRLTLVAVSCAGVVLGLTGCGNRITATRTFTSDPVVSYSFGPPGTVGSYENLTGPLNGANGTPAAGTRLHLSCYTKGQTRTDLFHCAGYVNTGHNTYYFDGVTPTITPATYSSLFAAGSSGQVFLGVGCCNTVNSHGQQVDPVVITLKP